MPTDDERRAVARRLRRSRSEWSGMGWRLWLGPKFCAVVLSDGKRDELEDAAHLLADLIEPTCDPTGRGIDSIYDWCRERLEGADGAEDELYCSIMRAIEDYRHPDRATAHTVRAVDRDALLELAEDVDEAAAMAVVADDSKGAKLLADMLLDIARRIRDALGVES